MLNFELEKSEVVLLRMQRTSKYSRCKGKIIGFGQQSIGGGERKLNLKKISFTLLNKMKTDFCHSNNSSIIDTKLGSVELLGSDQQYS